MAESHIPTELFLPFLQADTQTPRYQQLFRAFQQAILNGTLPTGTRLPASRPLAQALKLSRNTVKTAFEMLLAEGYIETRHGAGSYVSGRLPDARCTQPSALQQNNRNSAEPPLSRLAQRLQQMPDRNPPSNGQLLQTARPCLQSFPWSQWQRHVTAAARQMKHHVSSAPAGNRLLREQVADYLQVVRGLSCTPEQIIICAGSQQAVYMALRLLLNEGDPILVEDPGYQGIEGALIATGARKIAVPADSDGFQLDAGLAQCPEARVAMVTPSRNYPMGYTLSLARRLELIRWATDCSGWILEDDYDSEFRFDGPPLTALQGLGGEHRVIYTGTFSRILHPSIRLGYLVLPPTLVELFNNARRYLDGGLPQLPQQALATFMASGQFASHVRRMRKLYQQRRDHLHQRIMQQHGHLLSRVEADGGMHSVYLLPEGLDDQQIADQAGGLNLGIRALSRFYSQPSPPQGLVIGFAGYDEQQIDQGLTQLASLLPG